MYGYLFKINLLISRLHCLNRKYVFITRTPSNLGFWVAVQVLNTLFLHLGPSVFLDAHLKYKLHIIIYSNKFDLLVKEQ